MNNILLIDKPAGMTSHDVVDKVRITSGEKKVGHTGTLDPAVTGLLIVLVGREATKRQAEFLHLDKIYEAEIVFGAISDTYDREGEIQVSGIKYLVLSIERIQEILKKHFMGEIEQIPPIYSAIKVKGRKLYEYARKGQKVEIKPRKVNIYDIKILGYSSHPEETKDLVNSRAKRDSCATARRRHILWRRTTKAKGGTWSQAQNDLPTLNLRIHCSSGTYIRSIAHDLGQALGCGGYLNNLRRVKIGDFNVKDAVKLDDLNKI